VSLTVIAPTVSASVVEAGDPRVATFTALVDQEFLDGIGWDWATQVISVPSEHPLLGYRTCRAQHCNTIAYTTSGICRGCTNRMRSAGMTTEELLTCSRTWRSIGVAPCAVTGCRRPARTARSQLCHAHDYQRRKKIKLSMGNFLTHPQVHGLPSLGPCRVAACPREQDTAPVPYCTAHRMQRLHAQRGDPDFDEQRWRLIAPAVAEGGAVSLRGLAPLVIAQVLYGLQQRCHGGTKTVVSDLRRACDQLRGEQVRSIEQATTITRPGTATLWRQMVDHARRVLLDPETEKPKNIWEMAAFGFTGGRLNFTKIKQSWLREAAKRWVLEDLPHRRGDQIVGTLQSHIDSLVLLSESLRARRGRDHGDEPAALGRKDIDAFLNRLGHLQRRGTISNHRKTISGRDIRKILNKLRGLGLTRPGAVMGGLPGDFTIRPEDLPPAPERPEPGRDLPPEVMRQLCEHLPLIEQRSAREFRVATELLIDTGRRPDEICELAWDCLTHDSDGQPVLVYDNYKEQRQGRRLPIPKVTAELITGQKKLVRERFPHTPIAELKLLPSTVSNPDGRRAIADSGLGGRHRAWVDSLPPLLLADGTELDKSRVFPYAYRHTYAQRHADGGVPVDVLRELMDHKSMDVTKRYYRVGEQRRRHAVDKLTAMQFDRHGNRVWLQAKALLDSEHARRAIGEVVVPFGVCAEPSNVKAGGHACPYRFRCVGCDHFRTDVSYLPDLQTHLDDLLRNRERLLAATDVDQWARHDATPSDEEITRVRRLISRVKNELAELTPDERAQIEQAITVARQHRTVTLGMPRIRQPLPDIRPERPA
jgi:integrase